jgi:hypothetical protein
MNTGMGGMKNECKIMMGNTERWKLVLRMKGRH